MSFYLLSTTGVRSGVAPEGSAALLCCPSFVSIAYMFDVPSVPSLNGQNLLACHESMAE